MRAALLSSVSHDLRLPLATILGAASSLRELGAQMDQGARDDLVVAIEEEAALLSRQVENLRQMTRLQAGIALRKGPVDVGEGVKVVRAPGRVVTHRNLLKAVWGPAHGEDLACLRVFDGQLRAKIEVDPPRPTLIRTELGVGYRWDDAAG